MRVLDLRAAVDGRRAVRGPGVFGLGHDGTGWLCVLELAESPVVQLFREEAGGFRLVSVYTHPRGKVWASDPAGGWTLATAGAGPTPGERFFRGDRTTVAVVNPRPWPDPKWGARAGGDGPLLLAPTAVPPAGRRWLRAFWPRAGAVVDALRATPATLVWLGPDRGRIAPVRPPEATGHLVCPGVDAGGTTAAAYDEGTGLVLIWDLEG